MSAKLDDRALKQLTRIAVRLPAAAEEGAKAGMRALRDETAQVVRVRTGRLRSGILNSAPRVYQTKAGITVVMRSNVPYDVWVNNRYKHYEVGFARAQGRMNSVVDRKIQEALPKYYAG